MTVERALDVMRSGHGTHFDPTLLGRFFEALPRVLEIRARHPDLSTADGYGSVMPGVLARHYR
jgi:hypothetical protein